MRIKTSRTLRSIDNYKLRFQSARDKYVTLVAVLLASIGFAKSLSAIVSLFIIGISINFAFAQFAFLILLGLLILKLQFYRMANLLFGLASGRRSLRV